MVKSSALCQARQHVRPACLVLLISALLILGCNDIDPGKNPTRPDPATNDNRVASVKVALQLDHLPAHDVPRGAGAHAGARQVRLPPRGRPETSVSGSAPPPSRVDLDQRSSPAAKSAPASVTVQFVTVNPGSPQEPSTNTTVSASADASGVVLIATLLPARPTVANVEVNGGAIGSHTRFRGAVDLVGGQLNTLTVHPVGLMLRQDLAAEVITRFIASSSAFSLVTNDLTAQVLTAIAGIDRSGDAPAVYQRATVAAHQRLAALATTTGSGTGTSGGTRRIRVYVAGESIETRNHYVAPPFTATGALNLRGGGTLLNDSDEYGWMVPLADRLRLRDSSIVVEWVGSDGWLDADDQPYSGTYPTAVAQKTSAIPGTSIGAWVTQRRGELEARTFPYDLALISRGGNDFGNDDDELFKTELKNLIELVAAGSSATATPMIYVTGHMPDDQRGGSGNPDNIAYVADQTRKFVTRVQAAVNEIRTTRPGLRIRFVDMYSPFLTNRPTTAFPNEIWSSSGVPDFAKIGRVIDPLSTPPLVDLMHPRRLASIYAGEIVADAIDLEDLRATIPAR